MANTIVSQNMVLPVPVVGVDPGPDYAQNINNCLTLIDQHDHSPGYGVPITPSGLNINADLPLNGFNLITARSVRLQAQSAPIAEITDLGCIYESGVDLYYNDGVGNQIRLTQAGGVAGTSGSIGNLVAPASASYVSISQTFVFQSAANTPGNIDGASFVLRNLTANSKGLTLSPPASMPADYSITLPTAPATTNILTMTSSGVMAAALNVDNSTVEISSNNIQVKDKGITQIKLANRANSGATAPAGGVAISQSSSISANSNAYVDVSGLAVTLTTTGRPVEIRMISSAVDPGSIQIAGTVGIVGNWAILNGSTIIASYSLSTNAGGSTTSTTVAPSSCIYALDFPAAGVQNYKAQYRVQLGTGDVYVIDSRLMAYEI